MRKQQVAEVVFRTCLYNQLTLSSGAVSRPSADCAEVFSSKSSACQYPINLLRHSHLLLRTLAIQYVICREVSSIALPKDLLRPCRAHPSVA